jgi:hypothetical protein
MRDETARKFLSSKPAEKAKANASDTKKAFAGEGGRGHPSRVPRRNAAQRRSGMGLRRSRRCASAAVLSRTAAAKTRAVPWLPESSQSTRSEAALGPAESGPSHGDAARAHGTRVEPLRPIRVPATRKRRARGPDPSRAYLRVRPSPSPGRQAATRIRAHPTSAWRPHPSSGRRVRMGSSAQWTAAVPPAACPGPCPRAGSLRASGAGGAERARGGRPGPGKAGGRALAVCVRDARLPMGGGRRVRMGQDGSG